MSIDAQLADPTELAQVSPTPTLAPDQALQKLAARCGVAVAHAGDRRCTYLDAVSC